MPAVSKKQQKFFGMVRATQKGEMKNPSKEILDVANDISMKDAKKFAKTKHKGLPEKKKMNEDNVLKKVAKQLDGASKMHKQQANKVRKHIKDMHKEGMYDTDPKTGESPVATSVRKGNKKKGDDRLKHFAKLAKKMVGEENIDEKCWKGYEKKGMKTMFGKRYPNCVKKEEIEKVSEATTDYGSQTARDNDDNKAAVAARKRIYDRASEKDKNMMDARTISQQRNKVRGDRMKADQNKPEVDSVGSLIQKKLKVGKFKKMNEDVKRDEYGDPVGGPKISKKQKAKNLSSNTPDEQHTTTTSEAKYEVGASTYGKASIRNKRKFGTKGENPDPLTGKKITKDATRGELISKRREEHKAKRGMKEDVKRDEYGDPIGGPKISKKQLKKNLTANTPDEQHTTTTSEAASWTKKSGKNPSGGLNEKGRKSYERENPGSDLKAPSKKVGNPRRKSFCARMKGMRKRQKPSNNTGDDRLSKSLRAWNC